MNDAAAAAMITATAILDITFPLILISQLKYFLPELMDLLHP